MKIENMTTAMKWMIFAPLGLLFIALFAFLGGEIVRLLWNWLLPQLFGWKEVTFWQALGLLALCRILFGGFASRSGAARANGNIKRQITDRIVDRVAERWEQMTPEERERFRQRLRDRCGFDPATGESK